MTYKELVDQLDKLPLDSEERRAVKQKVLELDFAADMAAEFDEIQSETTKLK
jgi:hypothetical protein